MGAVPYFLGLKLVQDLVIEETGVIKHYCFEVLERWFLVFIEKAGQDIGDLSWVVPLSRLEVELVLSYLCYPLDREERIRPEIVEVVADRIVFFFEGRLEVILQNLGEEHLSYSDHTAPPCVRDERVVVAVFLQKLGET